MIICPTGMLCLQASVTNAIVLVVDDDYASNVLLKGQIPSIVSFASVVRWVIHTQKERF